MTNKKLTLFASIILVIAMLFSTLSVGAIDGTGRIDNLSTNKDIVTDFTYLFYEENSNLFEKIYGFFYLIFGLIG